jgi:nitroimidazol reductase NimA-like FMN-containing flavoprotein (pyridoxamine 5'-phosphate oxidase superfamily)
MRVTGSWSLAEASEFLRATHVPVRLSCHTPDGNLWMLSLWYAWVDGDDSDTASADGAESPPELRCATSADTDVVEYLRHDPAVAFEISTNDPPYRGVRGRGTVTIEPDVDKALLRSLLDRYLGGTDNELAEMLLDPDRDEVKLRIAPDRLHSWDFSDRMADVSTADGE